ncbi:MAG: hypothetical protein WAW59_00240 [Patescibacteria group bacterium]
MSTFFDVMLPYGLIAELSFVVALFVSLYSIYHAKKLQITRVDVEIRDLPKSWQ